jgi:hypothetical protein
MRLSAKISTIISLILTFLLLISLCVAAAWLPTVVNSLIDVTDNIGNRNELGATARHLILADAYLMIAVATAAVILLFFLLRAVLCEKVFTKTATRLLAAISWCCFAEGLLFGLLILPFQLAAGVAIAACFVGLCLRVVKNVIEEAIRIKSENDFTI